MARLFIKKLLFSFAAITTFSAHADLQKPLIEILDYDIARDFEAVKNIVKEGWATLSTAPYNEELVHLLFVRCQSCNRPSNSTTIKVIRVNGQTAGVMTFAPGYYGMVELLAVDSKFRNKGLGYQLLSTAQELAQQTNGQGLELYVFNTNTPAVKLYEKFGFRQEAYVGKNISLMGKPFNTQEADIKILPATITFA